MKHLVTRVKSEFDSAPLRTGYYGASLVAAFVALVAAIITYRNVLTVYVLPVAYMSTCVAALALINWWGPPQSYPRYLRVLWLHVVLLIFAFGLMVMTATMFEVASLIRILRETDALPSAAIERLGRFQYTLPWRFYSVLSFILVLVLLLGFWRFLYSGRVPHPRSSEGGGRITEGDVHKRLP